MTKKSTAKKAKRQADPAAEILAAAIDACDERKAQDGLVLDLRELNDATDYFLIVSGTSDTHVRAIAEHVIETLDARDHGKPYSIEGLAQGRWVLIDYVDMVVHVFHPELRSFYQLEGLWGEAPRRRLGA
jgi:ribosome-associated protein